MKEISKVACIKGKEIVMKTKILLITILFTAFLALPSMDAVNVYAWDDCPKGLVNDEYPGSCPRYIDTDENGICDHSEPAPEDRVENQSPVDQKQSGDTIAPNDNREFETTSKNTVLLSILVPLIAILGYAGIYKIKQSKIS